MSERMVGKEGGAAAINITATAAALLVLQAPDSNVRKERRTNVKPPYPVPLFPLASPYRGKQYPSHATVLLNVLSVRCFVCMCVRVCAGVIIIMTVCPTA